MTSPRGGNQELVEFRSRGPSRFDVLEDRIAMQERTLKNLIERAFKIKEDVINSLNFTQGTWQEEHKARLLLQDHVKTITNIVNKLSHEIASIENQIRARDTNVVGTNAAVKNLEVHHVTSLTDLRGRVVRCDSAIAKLSSDIRSIADGVKTGTHSSLDVQNKMSERVRNLELRVDSMCASIDKASGDHRLKLQHFEGDTSHKIAALESKTQSMIDELRTSLKAVQADERVEREKLEYRLTQISDKHSAESNNKLNLLSRKLEDTNAVIESRIDKVNDALQQHKTHVDAELKNMESKILNHLQQELAKQSGTVEKLKREFREGFSAVHESITNMKTVMDGKRRLLEEQLRKDIGQIRKMVVLV